MTPRLALSALTAHQLGLVADLLDGERDLAAIATDRGIAYGTMKNAASAIYDRLGMSGRVELMARMNVAGLDADALRRMAREAA